MIRGAIFDADGTLLDSMGMWDEAPVRFLESFGLRPRPDLQQILFPLTMRQCAEYIRQAYALPLAVEEIEDGINGIARRFYEEEVRAKPGALRFLQLLRRRGVRCVLATNTERLAIEAGLRRTEPIL